MLELIMGLIGPYMGWLVALIGGLLAVVGIFFKGKNSGKAEERGKQMEASYESERSRVQTEADVRAAPQPESDRMRDRYRRD